ncbi:MAG: response regulator [Bacteroidota bacterium]
MEKAQEQDNDRMDADQKADAIQSLRILLVEDKVVNQKVISLMLQSMQHKVTLAVNGEDALQKYKPGSFDLILMDIQMPVMDGITATEKLKEKYKKGLPPIVGLSANAFEGDREKYMKKGMDEYLTKPVKEYDFARIINTLKDFES